MDLRGDAKLVRVYIGESDMYQHIPVYEHIVLEARKFGLAGATVLKGIMGFGKSSRIHTAKLLRLSEDMPLVIEIVDADEKITGFLPVLEALLKKAESGGLVTVEKVGIITYSGKQK